MIQLYPITILFLIFVSAMYFLEVWKTELAILLRFKHWLLKKQKARKAFFAAAIIIGILKLFFPMYPGPMILGDLMPSLALFYSSFYFVKLGKAEEDHMVYGGGTRDNPWFRKGVILIAAALVHLLFPHFVLL